MSNIIEFPVREDPHRSGPARCLNCQHTWEAQAPIGTTQLECPACRSHQGVFEGLAKTEFRQWQCNCGEFTFFLDEHSPYCAHCGTRV